MIANLLGDTVQKIVETHVNPSEGDLGVGVSRGPAFEIAA
jgi:hypothetical protein